MANEKRRIAENEYEFMYAGARVRALEARLPGQDVLDRLTELPSSAAVLSALAEYGFNAAPGADGKIDREALLLSVSDKACAEVREAGADERLPAVIRLPYDCNNVKAVIKCRARKVSPASMLFSNGLIAPDALNGTNEEIAALLPPHMAAAFTEAVTQYAATGNPQVIDMLLDKACFADMADAASKSACPLAVWYVGAKIDLTNLQMCLRLLRMHVAEAGKAQLQASLLAGGTMGTDVWETAYDAGEEALWDVVQRSPYASLAVLRDSSPAVIERKADNYLMERVQKTRYVPFGQDVIFGYLLANEYLVRNLRILLSGKDAGLSPADVRERMRLSYV